LQYRKDRWNNCLLEFEKYNIKNNLERFDAIIYNNKNLDKKQNAQIGCLFSHYSVLKKAQKENYNKILVLEDDFIFNFCKQETLNNLEMCFNDLPIDWDLFYLGAYFVKGYDYEAKISYSDYLYKANTAFTAHSICYSKIGIKKMVDCMEKAFISMPLFLYNYETLDWFYVKKFLYNNNCYASKKFLCGQRIGFSDIEGKVIDSTNFFLKGYE
jgi:GR25 family glycosyltransferase involved in LPS biosynthesis